MAREKSQSSRRTLNTNGCHYPLSFACRYNCPYRSFSFYLCLSPSWSLALSLSVAGCLSGLLFARTFIRQTKVARKAKRKNNSKKINLTQFKKVLLTFCFSLSISFSFSVCLFAVCCFLLFDKKRIKPKSKTLSSFCANESIKIVSRMKLNEKTAQSLTLTPFPFSLAHPLGPTACTKVSGQKDSMRQVSLSHIYLTLPQEPDSLRCKSLPPCHPLLPPCHLQHLLLLMRHAHLLAKGLACFCLFVIYATFLISSRKNEFSRTQPLESSKPNSCEITECFGRT